MKFYTPYCRYGESYEYIKDNINITKDSITEYIFFNISMEIIRVKKYAKTDKIKLSKVDIRMCIGVCFQQYKLILDDYKLNLNMEDENNYFDEYLSKNKLNLKTKKYSLNY
jgi:hypothetical protein